MDGYTLESFWSLKPSKNFDQRINVVQKKSSETQKSLISAAGDIIDKLIGNKIGKGFNKITK